MGLFRTLRRGATWLSVGAAAGAAVVTVRHVLATPQPLDSALDGEGRIDRKHGGDLYYDLGGPHGAQPLVLLHDFYPGASNFEFRNIFAPLAERYRVYAPDWLGFGMSEHPAVAYTGEFYASMLAGFLRDVVTEPAVVVAHGRAANIAVRTASDAPALFERLVLVAPDVFAGVLAEPTLGQTLIRGARRVSLGILPYALLSTRPALRLLTASRSQRAAEGVPADDEVDHLYASAHQVGGQHALLAAFTGDLDLAMPNAFALLEPPVLLISGELDQRHPRLDMEDIAVLNPHADLDVIPGAGDIVFADAPDAFVRAVMDWLDTPASRHTLDEGALLQPEGGPTPQLDTGARETDPSLPLTAEAHGELVMDAEEQTPELATEGNAPPRFGDAQSADEEIPEEMPGTPASVVPGVSDAGMEGPATMDVAGVTTLDEPTVTLGAAPTEESDDALHTATETDAPDELLPEAGEADAESAVERQARKGEDPSRLPEESNIADVPVEQSAGAGRGDVAGLAQTVQTPDSGVTTTADVAGSATVATARNVAGANDVTPTEAASRVSAEDQPEELPAEDSSESLPTTFRGKNTATRQMLSRTSHEQPPRRQPRTANGAKSASRNNAGRGATGGGRGASQGGQGQNQSSARKRSTHKNSK